MRSLMNSVTGGAKEIFESPKLAATLYMGALVAVLITTGLREGE